MNKTLPYSRHLIDEEDIRAVVEVLKSDYLTQGAKTGEFEEALAKYCGSRHAVVFSSGTAALHGAYFSAGIGPGDEVITSPMTFAATANAALYLGAKVVFVDIEADTGNLNPALLADAVTDKTKAVVPVHYAGQPADMDPILEIARRRGITVIEDACHAIGASYKGRKIGSISDMTVVSFHPVKPITTGEGGAVLTNSGEFAGKLRMFRTHGITKEQGSFRRRPHGAWHYEMHLLGYNYRMTDIQAALGISQIKKLDGFIEKRRGIASFYKQRFSAGGRFELLEERPYAGSSLHLFPLLLYNESIEKKAEIFTRLKEEKRLGVQVHYIPVYMHPYYLGLGYREGLCPAAEDFYKRALSIPIHQSMQLSDAEQVAEAIEEVLGPAD